jgi:hypothetical protein
MTAFCRFPDLPATNAKVRVAPISLKKSASFTCPLARWNEFLRTAGEHALDANSFQNKASARNALQGTLWQNTLKRIHPTFSTISTLLRRWRRRKIDAE